ATNIYVRLTATATVEGSPSSGDIVLTSMDAANVNVPTMSSTVDPLAITTSGAVVSDKVYDGSDAAVITGAIPVGTVNGDDITIIGDGTFAQITVGTDIAVTAALTLSGTNATSYTLTQPVGLTGDITPLDVNITGLTADNKVYDMTTTATLSGTPVLTGVIPADESDVTLTG